MNEVVNSETQNTEFDKLLAESINKSNLKEGSIIQGIVSEKFGDKLARKFGAKYGLAMTNDSKNFFNTRSDSIFES